MTQGEYPPRGHLPFCRQKIIFVTGEPAYSSLHLKLGRFDTSRRRAPDTGSRRSLAVGYPAKLRKSANRGTR